MMDSTTTLRLIKYALLQTTIAPSLICDLLVFIHFIRHWRKAIITSPQNHIILCLLIVSFAQKISDIPLILYFLRWGVVAYQSDTFCTVWTWWDYTAYTVSVQLVAWCCIEKHLFIFHSHMMKKKCWLILCHYVPMMICLLYMPLFYLSVIIFPQTCANAWDYTYIFCGSPCYPFNPFLGTYDWLFHYATPLLIISFTNLLLCGRVVWQKLKRQQRIQWHRQKYMIIQLAFVSILYLIFMTPEVIVGVIESLWSPTFALDIQLDYFYYISAFINQCLPFVIVGSLPEMRKELRQWIEYMKRGHGRGTRVEPFLTRNPTADIRLTASVLH